MDVIKKIATDFNQIELTKEKYYELYNVGVSLLRTIDSLDPEKGRRADMGQREVTIQCLKILNNAYSYLSMISLSLIPSFLELKCSQTRTNRRCHQAPSTLTPFWDINHHLLLNSMLLEGNKRNRVR
jgi:hypothetical protein